MAQGQKPFYLALGAVAVVGALFLISRVMGVGVVSIPANVTVMPSDTSGFRGYILGSENAPIEISEYADFTCPGCAAFATVQFPDVKARLIETGKVRFRYRDLPLDGPGHENSRIVAHAAACADDQGKFWEMKPQLYRRQSDYVRATNPMGVLTEAAESAGLDVGTWKGCMKSATHAGRIQASLEEGSRLGVGSTPSFLLGGRIYAGMNSDQMVRLVDSLILMQSGTPAR